MKGHEISPTERRCREQKLQSLIRTGLVATALAGLVLGLVIQLKHLQKIADTLDDAEPSAAVPLYVEANSITAQRIVAHEREDESAVYPRLARFSPTATA